MLARIHALNNTDSSEESDSGESDNEFTLTKEALEELALKEYNRALNLLAAGKTDISVKLMKDLLDCDVLIKTVKPIIPDTVDRPILRVKYCLHRNLAASAAKQEDYKTALHHYCMACDLDGTDCYVWYKLGQVAMKANRFDLALHAFEQGLSCNSNHWPSMDCLVRLLYAMGHPENCLHYIEMALKKEPQYIRGHFLKNLIFSERPFLKKYYEDLEFPEIIYDESRNEEFIEDINKLREQCCDVISDDPCDDKIGVFDVPIDFLDNDNKLTLSGIGSLLLKIFDYLKDNKLLLYIVNFTIISERLKLIKTEILNEDDDSMSHINYALESIVQQNMEVLKQQSEGGVLIEHGDDLLRDTKIYEILSDDNINSSSEKPEIIEISDTNDKDSKDYQKESETSDNNDDKDNLKDETRDISNAKLEQLQQTGTTKLMKKRRGSELAMLDHWGKCKQRRSSRKKNNENVTNKCDDDETVEDALKRILPPSLLPEGLKIWKTKRIVYEAHSEDSMNTMDLYELFENEQAENSQKSKADEIRVKTPSEEELSDFVEMEINAVKSYVEYCIVQPRDVSQLMRTWLKYLSDARFMTWPKNLNEIFVNIYLKHREILAEHPWIFTDEADLLEEDANITLTFLEFYFDSRHYQDRIIERYIQNSSDSFQLFSEDLNYLDMLGGRGDIFAESSFNFSIRFLWLKALDLYSRKKSDKAIECLQYVVKCIEIEGDENFIIKLPNCKASHTISLNTAKELLKKWERMENLLSLKKFYDKKLYDKIADILMDYLVGDESLIVYDDFNDEEEDNVIPRPILLHIFLESLWVTEQFEVILKCSILCLYECCQQYFTGNVGLISQTWANTIQSILCYTEAILKLEDPYSALATLTDNILGKLVKCLCNIIVHQLCERSMKIYQHFHKINLITPWILLYHIAAFQESRGRDENLMQKKTCPGYSKWIVQQLLSQPKTDEFKTLHEIVEEPQDDDSFSLSTPVLLLFTAHDYLGKRKLCAANNGLLLSFMLDELAPRVKFNNPRRLLQENLEQCCYCLYGHPPKKSKPRYVAEHDVAPIEMKWEDAHKIYEIYRPEKLPEFDGRVSAINADTEILLQRIIQLMPMLGDIQTKVTAMNKYIFGSEKSMPQNSVNIHHQMINIFYLLGDFYMKNRDMPKAIKYYTMDVCIVPSRLDSWAGMALAQAAQIETKLNSCEKIRSENKFIDKAFATTKCFEHTLEIDPKHCVLLIEFGSFSYLIHSYWSRLLKQASETLSMERFSMLENRKESMLERAYLCFTDVRSVWPETTSEVDERWLHHYMLGKIAEKLKKDPSEYLNHYWESSRLLEENNACYPRKINYTNQQHLAVEALEVFYRLHASILKYLEHHNNTNISRELGELFVKHLTAASKGPFGKPELLNIILAEESDEHKENLNKRKLETISEEIKADATSNKIAKLCDSSTVNKSPVQSIDLCEPQTPKVVLNDEPKMVTSTPIDKPDPVDDSIIIISDSDEETTKPNEQDKEKSNNIICDSENQSENVESKQLEKPPEIIDPQERLNHLMKECLEKMEFAEEAETEPESRRLSQSSSNARQSSSTSSSSSDDSSSENSNDSNNSSSSDDSSSSSSSSSSSDSEDDTSKASSKASKTSKSSRKSLTTSSKPKKKSEFLTKSEIDKLVTICIINLEECIHRCAQHYKAFYRLGYHFLKHGVTKKQLTDYQAKNSNGPPITGTTLCKQLLMSTYNPDTEFAIQGLFSERKPHNFFNGIWRLPASDVDRAGSFASHMSRCVTLLMEVLMDTGDHRTLLEICLQLQKTPEADKKYLRDPEREELSQQALTLCVQTLRSRLKKLSETKIKADIKAFLLEVFRSYKKAKKYLLQKEKSFSSLLVDAYKLCSNGKDGDTSHLLDSAIRFCQQQITAKKQISQMPSPTSSSQVCNNFAPQQLQQQQQQPAHQQQPVINNVVTPIPIIQQPVLNPNSPIPNLPTSTNTVIHTSKPPRGRPPNNTGGTYNITSDQSQFSNMLLNQYMSMLSDISKLPQAAAAQMLSNFQIPLHTTLSAYNNVLANQPNAGATVRSPQARMNPTANINSSCASLGINSLMNPISPTNLNVISAPSKGSPINVNCPSPALNTVPKKTSTNLASNAFNASLKQGNTLLPSTSSLSPSKNPYNITSYMNPNFTGLNNDLNNMFKNFFQSNLLKKSSADSLKRSDKYKYAQNMASQKNTAPVPQDPTYNAMKKVRQPKLNIDGANKPASNVMPKSMGIKQKNDCLPNSSAITCTVVSSKEKQAKAHQSVTTSLPSITITPVQKATHSYQQKLHQEPSVIRSQVINANPTNISTSPAKSLQEKLAEKKKNSMESKIIRID